MTSIRSMLLVTHECTLTGAPMNLLHFARWLVDNTEVEVEVLALAEGPLVGRFADVCPTTVLDRGTVASMLALGQRSLLQLGSRRAWKPLAQARYGPQLRHLRRFDVVYLNSATTVSVLPYLKKPKLVVSHVHELDVAFTGWRPPSDLTMFDTAPDLYIVASHAVERMLVERRGIDSAKVETHHEFIDTEPFADYRVDLRKREETLNGLRAPDGRPRIPSDAAIVMGSGTIDWRKGADLFVQLSTEVARQISDPVWFVWVGGDHGSIEMSRLVFDQQRSHAHRVVFVPPQDDPRPYYAAADVFALTSREDPFPLVCLEHAAMGHPVVAYDSGGIGEFIAAAGPAAALGVVDYLDVGTMAQRVVDYLTDDDLRRAAGAELRERVRSHHDVAVAAPRLYESIETRFASATR